MLDFAVSSTELSEGILPVYLEERASATKKIALSQGIDEVFKYFNYIGQEHKIDESLQDKLFAPNFQMIINGRVVVDGREHLTPHFQLLLDQVSRIDILIHEKIVANDSVVMRYDVEKPGKTTSKVIAIFKFDNGQVYEMNEVVFSVDPSKEVDFTSR